MGCCVQTAKRKMEEAGIKVQMQSFAHGRKAYWNVTEERVREIAAEEQKRLGTNSRAPRRGAQCVGIVV
ncbi:hypothetical protein ABD07_03925 [Nitrosomonas oligotropha]|nr:hypothetical protein [Nitrosomonas oligotropha]